MDPRDASLDQQEGLRAVQRTATALVGRLKALAALRPGTAQGVGDLEAALEKLGDPETFITALRDTVAQGGDLVSAAKARRGEVLRQAVSAFVRDVDGRFSVREVAAGWRVGPVALEIQPQEARVRALYNDEVVVPWTVVAGVDDVAAVHAKAMQQLESVGIPEDRLIAVINEAYDAVLARAGRPAPHHLRLDEVLGETRLVLAREALSSRRQKDAEGAIRLPLWALLYAFDRFRAASATQASASRLLVETGTVREGEKFGVILNGLDAGRDYQRFCYVQRVSEG